MQSKKIVFAETIVQVLLDNIINIGLVIIAICLYGVAPTVVTDIFIMGLAANCLKSFAVRWCFNRYF